MARKDGLEGEYVTDETTGKPYFVPGIQEPRPLREVNVVDGQTVFVQPHDPEPPKTSWKHHEWFIREAVRNDYPLIHDWIDVGWYRNAEGKMTYCWDEPFAPRSVIERLIDAGVSGEWRRAPELALEEFVVDDENSHPDIPKKNAWLRQKLERRGR